MIVKVSCQTEMHPNPREGTGWNSYTTKIKQRLSLHRMIDNASIQLFNLGAVAIEDMKVELFISLESSGDEGVRLKLLVRISESPEVTTLLNNLAKLGLHIVTRKED